MASNGRYRDGGTIAEDELALHAPSLTAAAHELKAPLALLRQLSLTLESATALNLEEGEQRDMLRKIVLTTERSLRLTESLTRTTRLDDSLFDLEPLDMANAAGSAAQELIPLFESVGRTIDVTGIRAPLALANPELVRLIAINLCDNAFHYGKQGTPIHISISSRDSGRVVRMSIRDKGPDGFSSKLARVARNLDAGPQDISKRPSSSGLGLYIAGQCARKMHGRLGLVRHHDGASFYLEVPSSRQMEMFSL